MSPVCAHVTTTILPPNVITILISNVIEHFCQFWNFVWVEPYGLGSLLNIWFVSIIHGVMGSYSVHHFIFVAFRCMIAQLIFVLLFMDSGLFIILFYY